MKRIEAFLRPHRLGKVIAALHALPHFPGFTVFDAHGQGHGRGTGGHYVYGEDEGVLLHERCVLVVICADEQA
ncbi:P-II family nitrogen regulator, partial [Acinetobacter baumannii]